MASPVGMKELREKVGQVVEEVLLPLIEKDGGMIFLVEASETLVHLRLSKNCAGCPGFEYTKNYLVMPVIREVTPEGVQIKIENCFESNQIQFP